MRRLRLALLFAGPLLLALLAVLIIALGGGPALPPPRPAPPPPEPPSFALPVRAATAAPASPRDASPGTFAGTVRSAATGAELADAELTFAQGGVAATVQAGADGAFLFRPPAAGRWLLAAASARGYFPFAPEWGFSPVQLDAAPGRHVRGLDVFLSPAVEIDGVVVDEDGLPVAGAEVRLLGAGGEATLITIPDRFLTGADGTFRAAAPRGSVLEAHKDGYYPGSARVDVQALVDGRVRILLGSARAGPGPARPALAGVVVGPDGRPVTGALVEAAKTHGWAYGGAPVDQAVTGADGRFRIGGLTRSPHLITVRAEGFVPESLGRVLPGNAELRIALRAGGRVHGCVHDEGTGAPVAPYTLRAYFETNGFRGDPDLELSVADPSGCFTVGELRPGLALLVVLAPGHAPSAPVEVEVPAAGVAQVEVGLGLGGALTGVLRDEFTGEPLSGAWVAAEAVQGTESSAVSSTVAETTTGLDGTFTLRGLPERVRIVANAAGHHAACSYELGVPPEAVTGLVSLELRPVRDGDAGPIVPVGIGAVLQAAGDGVAIGRLRPGTTAEASGLAPGDELLEIDGHAVAALGLGGAVEAMRGPEGTTAYLTVRRGNSTLELEVPRRRGP
jgi:hypothetical protein